MNRQVVLYAALAWSVAMGLFACESGGGDASVTPARDAGADATGGDVEAGDDAPAEVSSPDGDAGVPRRVLLSYNGTSQSELVAFGITSKAVDGRLVYPGFIGAAQTSSSADPWLLEQSNDVVARMDRVDPWVVRSSWNVAMHDQIDGGDTYSDPDAVVVSAGTKAYVLRFTRNDIAILDPSGTADGGAPMGSIDVSGQVQPAGDGIVEMSAGVYVPSRKIVYVLLANLNRGNVGCNGYCLLCANTKATVVGIDVTTDALVDLNGSAPGIALTLNGYSPGIGQGTMAYDAQGDRLLVLHSGCNQPPTPDAGADGGVGPLVQREVEELALATGQTRELLDLTQAPFPQQIVYIDAHHAILQTDKAYAWDPTQPTLGAAIPNAPDSFAWDGVGSLVGVTARYGADGGPAGYDVVSVSVPAGTVTKLGADPFSLTAGFVGGVQLWPAR
jgi:hypothetical protein